uniref:Uncharacterized protein n=1 Tax=Tetranychus urticae TaxID=32264 RepID=T1KES5_TETUR
MMRREDKKDEQKGVNKMNKCK